MQNKHWEKMGREFFVFWKGCQGFLVVLHEFGNVGECCSFHIEKYYEVVSFWINTLLTRRQCGAFENILSFGEKNLEIWKIVDHLISGVSVWRLCHARLASGSRSVNCKHV